MTRLFTTCAIVALSTCLCGPMLAQSTTAPVSPDQTMPNNGSSGSTMSSPAAPQTSPTQGQTAATDLTGQSIYTAQGRKIGTVSSMSTDAQGQQSAAVSIEKYLGMGGQTVMIPVSSLQARDKGGFTTTLSAAEIKALGKSGSTSTSTP